MSALDELHFKLGCKLKWMGTGAVQRTSIGDCGAAVRISDGMDRMGSYACAECISHFDGSLWRLSEHGVHYSQYVQVLSFVRESEGTRKCGRICEWAVGRCECIKEVDVGEMA